MNPGRRFLLLALLVLLALGIGVGLFISWEELERRRVPRTTYDVAEAYLSAVIDGDKKAALNLYRGDALCSAPFPYPSDRMDEHIALLASSEVRNVAIQVEPAQGVPYTPGSEKAQISFEYRIGPDWYRGTIWLVLGPVGKDGRRFICHL